MKKNIFLQTAFIALMLIVSTSAFAQNKMSKDVKTVGGAPMYPTKNIVENAVNSKDHTRLVAAAQAAGLVETLLKPENKATLQGVLTYHVVAGRISAADIDAAIRKGNGTATFSTVAGGKLTAKLKDGGVQLTD